MGVAMDVALTVLLAGFMALSIYLSTTLPKTCSSALAMATSYLLPGWLIECLPLMKHYLPKWCTCTHAAKTASTRKSATPTELPGATDSTDLSA